MHILLEMGKPKNTTSSTVLVKGHLKPGAYQISLTVIDEFGNESIADIQTIEVVTSFTR